MVGLEVKEVPDVPTAATACVAAGIFTEAFVPGVTANALAKSAPAAIAVAMWPVTLRFVSIASPRSRWGGGYTVTPGQGVFTEGE